MLLLSTLEGSTVYDGPTTGPRSCIIVINVSNSRSLMWRYVLVLLYVEDKLPLQLYEEDKLPLFVLCAIVYRGCASSAIV